MIILLQELLVQPVYLFSLALLSSTLAARISKIISDGLGLETGAFTICFCYGPGSFQKNYNSAPSLSEPHSKSWILYAPWAAHRLGLQQMHNDWIRSLVLHQILVSILLYFHYTTIHNRPTTVNNRFWCWNRKTIFLINLSNWLKLRLHGDKIEM